MSRRFLDIAFVVAFAALSILPVAAAQLWPWTSELKSSPIAPAPKVSSARSLETFPAAFDAYFQTHIGMRHPLAAAYAYVNYRWLRTSPTKTVTVGKDGWLFLNQERMRESFLGAAPFSPADLDQWVLALSRCRSVQKQWGGELLVVVAPNKDTVYPEMTPASLRDRRGPTRYDAIAERLAREGIPFLDLRPLLARERQRADVYGKFDTHWNGAGALVAAKAIAAEVSRLTGKPVPIDEARLDRTRPRLPGDLSFMLGLDNVIGEPFPTVAVARPKARRDYPGPQAGPTTKDMEKKFGVFYSVDDARLPTAVIHRDSFGTSLLELLMDSFRKSRWLWMREFHPPQIREVHPDIVILEVAERYLEGPPLEVRF